jgi:amino acid adenylation domain-containing protein
LDVSAGIARFDLHLFVVEEESGIRGYVSYNTDLFTAATIDRMLGHFQTLLAGIVANPEQRLSELPILTEAERRQLLVEWNDTKRDYPKDKCVHELFEEQVERTPDAIAVVFPSTGSGHSEDSRLTYRELNRRANQLAHYLRKRGVGPEALVGVCVERSLEMVVGLLGILKAGGAYVPMDANSPNKRLAFMLQDAHATVVLTQEKFLPEIGGRTVLCLDRNWKEIAQQSAENPDRRATAENLAYVIYTSGSTGQPKGVEVPHRAVLRLLFGVNYARFDAARTFLQLAPASFDASIFELWGALLHGARCVLFPGAIPDPTELGTLLHQHKITTLWLTASLFNAVIDEAPEALSGVRQLLIGGEALSAPHVRCALSRLPEMEIINGYGPTESTTFACCYPIPPQLDGSINSIPIGRPIGNTEVYLLDRHLSPVPIGIPGELHIGGDGLARGYLNRPELTAEKFIPHPFSSRPGARLYKTGDLARYLPDGNIEFLGRLDHQVKIRGFRIEPGEIEAALNQHPAVRDCVVVAQEDDAPDPSTALRTGQRLIAYVVPKQQPSPTAGELRDFLKQRLPDYMIPSIFILLDALPRTPHGKLDRGALPAPDARRPEQDNTLVEPRTPAETALAKIWAQVLRLERVGVHDNFFDLGGHSLLAIQVISRVREAFRVEVSLRSLFETPTVAGLADAVQQARESGAEIPATKISPAPRQPRRMKVPL